MKTFTGTKEMKAVQFTGENFKECFDFVFNRSLGILDTSYAFTVELICGECSVSIAWRDAKGYEHGYGISKNDWLIFYNKPTVFVMSDQEFKNFLKKEGLK